MIRFRQFHEACWDTHKQIGMKKKGNRMVPNCVPKNEEAELDEGLDPSEIAGNPKMYDAATAKKAYYHKSATADDKKSLERHLDRHHGNKQWRKSVKESKDEQFKVGDFVKDHTGKIHRVFGVNGTNLETGIHYGKDKYGGTNNLHVSKAKKVPRPQDVKEEAKLEEGDGGSESWEAGYKRRVVKTTSAEHKEKGHNWRIKGKDRPEISIKLYKEKPSQAEFNKQMKRVAGHEFGG